MTKLGQETIALTKVAQFSRLLQQSLKTGAIIIDLKTIRSSNGSPIQWPPSLIALGGTIPWFYKSDSTFNQLDDEISDLRSNDFADSVYCTVSKMSFI